MLNKTFCLFLLSLIPLLGFSQANSQYPDSGNKIRLGFQTTADGLIWRDTQPNVGVYQPVNNKAAWIILDTMNNKFYHYKNSTWTLAGGQDIDTANLIATKYDLGFKLSLADTATMLLPYWRSGRFSGVLPVANGGTGEDMSDLPNNYLVRKNASGIFDTSAVFEERGNIGVSTKPNNFIPTIKAINIGHPSGPFITGNSVPNGSFIFGLNAVISGEDNDNRFRRVAPFASNQYVMARGNHTFSYVKAGNAGTPFEPINVMRIDSNSRVGIMTLEPSQALHVVGNARITGAYNVTTGSAANVFVTTEGVLQRSTSSIKYKTDVEDYSKGLKEVMQLRPVTFKSINSKNDKIYAGFIAEELADLKLNELVENNDSDEPDAISYAYMVTLLTKAIQEQQEQINQLKKRLLTLENK